MDAKESDHAYPRHVKCFSWGCSSESLFSSSVIVSGEQRNGVKPNLFSLGCGPPPSYTSSNICLKSLESEHDHLDSGCEAHKRTCLADIPVKCQDTHVSENTGKGHMYVSSSQEKRAGVASIPLYLEGVDSHTMKHKQAKTKKPNNRETDHMYNTRKTKTMDESPAFRKITDHVKDTKKTESTREMTSKSTQEITTKKPNNRDTDHLYNMRNAETLSQERTGSSKCSVSVYQRRKRVRGGVDMRGVDNDHMYHDKIKKKRSKLDNKGRTTRSKSQSLGNSVTSKGKTCALQSLPENLPKDQTHVGSLSQRTCAGDIILPANHKRTEDRDCTFDTKSNLMQTTLLNVQSDCKDKVCSDFVGDEVPGPLSEHAYTSMQSKRFYVSDATSAVPVSTGATDKCHSPAISDNDSDHFSEDNDNRMGIFQTDHMYVHADYLGSENLCEAKTKCVSAEGYKQEHSYASSSETHYDACVNCSELVQHLIGTIRQQRGHIDELEQKLQNANAKNKYLSMMFSQQVEGVN